MQIRDFSKRSFRSIFKWGAPDVFYDVDDRLRTFIRDTLELPFYKYVITLTPEARQPL